MANVATQTLQSIPFGTLIGGPMKAAIEAQAQAAKSTVDFITTVGFEPKEADADPLFPDENSDPNMGDVRNVTFKYEIKDPDGEDQEATLRVPLLTIVPIPFIRIDEMTIDFTAKITEIQTHDRRSSAQSEQSAQLSARWQSWWSPVSAGFKASYSSKHSSTSASASRYQTEYTMNVNVRAVQDDIPAGLSRVLNILESTINDPSNDENSQ